MVCQAGLKVLGRQQLTGMLILRGFRRDADGLGEHGLIGDCLYALTQFDGGVRCMYDISKGNTHQISTMPKSGAPIYANTSDCQICTGGIESALHISEMNKLSMKLEDGVRSVV